MGRKKFTDLNGKTIEPKYVAEGHEFDETDGVTFDRRPKWQRAGTKFQVDILSAVGRKYFLDHNERSAVLAIEKALMSLQTGVISTYPQEWVDSCINWVCKKRRDGTPIQLTALLNLINNNDRKQNFIASWKQKNPNIQLRKDVAEEVDNSTQEIDDTSHLEI